MTEENKNLTLAITTIGDLLTDNCITKDAEGKKIEDVRLSLPRYQRPYKWTVRNATQLLDDIVEAMNESKGKYRVGTLILHHHKNKYDIVDGQQRVITFALLLKVLKQNKNSRLKEISILKKKLDDNEFNRRNVADNYNAFARRMDSIEEAEALKIEKYLLDNCEMIVVITTSLSEAFQFFDSQNSRGKELYPHDLLKAFHLREMGDIGTEETVKTVRMWEDINQRKLADLFGEYLYRVREWANGDRAYSLNEQNIYKFKGITKADKSPYAQYYKSAYSYANMVNNSAVPFVTGQDFIKPFQLNAPIVAGKPFFEYTKHYFDILHDVQDNSLYKGYFINGNEIVYTLDEYYKKGVGNSIVRVMFDLAALLYIDRFCPVVPSHKDIELFEQFVIRDFIWAYSLRAQYINLGWQSAQNYILGCNQTASINSFNLYKEIVDADSPTILLSILSEKLRKMPFDKVRDKRVREKKIKDTDENGIYENYLHFFESNKYFIE